MIAQKTLTLCLITGAFVFLPVSVFAQGVPVIYPGQEKVLTLNSYLKKAEQKVTSANDYITKQKETLVQGFGSTMSPVTDSISDATKYVGDQIESAGDYASEQAKAAGDYVSESFSSSDTGKTDTAGSGFSLSKTASSVKGAYSEYGQYVSPALGLATGNFSLQDAGVIQKSLFIDNSNDNITVNEVAAIRANLKKFINESSKTTLADATKIMNGSTQFSKTKTAASASAKKSINIKEDIDTTSGADISMNVMTNVLLSMDITTLGVQSGTVYQEINSLKSSGGSGGGLSGAIPSIPSIGGL